MCRAEIRLAKTVVLELIVFRDPAGIKLNPSHQCGVLRVERPLTEEAGAGHCGKREGVCGRKTGRNRDRTNRPRSPTVNSFRIGSGRSSPVERRLVPRTRLQSGNLQRGTNGRNSRKKPSISSG